MPTSQSKSSGITMRTFTKEARTGGDGKRNRPPISCQPCRTRKLKCNRGSPCDTCIKRNKQSSCQYADNANRNTLKRDKTGDRLQKLENIVLQFVQSSVTADPQRQDTAIIDQAVDHATSSATTGIKKPTEERGTLHFQGGQMNFVDSSHWLSILHDIKEVRESLSSSQGQDNDLIGVLSQEPETDLVFGILQPPTLREIISSLPPRPICDSLLSQYFNMQFFVLPILHPVQFQKEYERFWQDSTKSPTLWIGLLFCILGIMTTLRQMTNTPVEYGGDSICPKMFRLRTTQCLVLGNYSAAKSYGLETLLLHLQSNLLGLADSNINIWFLMGNIIRLAMRMGYHRDSRNHPSISPFEGEMRRRSWAVIFQLDVLMSFQLGLPSMIPTDYCDAEPPRNLTFADFAPDSVCLPPSRPLSDQTPALYFIVKGKVMNVFRKIVTHTQSLNQPPLETTVVLDMEMRETYSGLPPEMKMMPISRSFMDTPSTIMKRCSIELIYLKSIVVLNRRFLNKETSDLKYANFRNACVDAGMEILARQADLHEACQPGGLLSNDIWMVSSLTAHDFLLAAMVVCLYLSVNIQTDAAGAQDMEFSSRLKALQISQTIWSSKADSKEARTAAQALSVMIRAVEGRTVRSTGANLIATDQETSMLGNLDLPYAEPMADMIDGSENLDWALLDQYFQNCDASYEFGYNFNEDQSPSMEPE